MVKNQPEVKEMQVQSLGRKVLWRRKWQLTPVFLPGKSHGQRGALRAIVHGVAVGHDLATEQQ